MAARRISNVPYLELDEAGVLQIVDAKHDKGEQCRAKGCRHYTFPGKRDKYCSRCKTYRWRRRNPHHARFKAIHDRAKQRGQEFSVSYEEFIEALGDKELSSYWHLDRKDARLGYVPGNIRILSDHDNLVKAAADKKLHQSSEIDCPF